MISDATPQERAKAQAFLKDWGVSQNAPASLQEHALDCARYHGSRMGAILSEIGLVSSDKVEEALQGKPTNVLTLEYLVSAIPSLQQHFLRILAISRGILYLQEVQETWAEAGNKLPGAARARLDELNAAYMVMPDGLPLVIFSDVSSLLKFTQAGWLEKSNDPLRGAISEPLGVALAPPAIVARSVRSTGGKNEALTVMTATQDNHWAPNMAKTEAERVLARILDEAISRGATDVAIAPLRDGTSKVRFRQYGDMTSPERNAVLSPQHTKELTNFLVSRSRAGDGGRLRHAADGQMTYKNAQSEVFIRASFIPADRFGQDFDMISTSLRLLPRDSTTIALDNLNLHTKTKNAIRNALHRSQGLIVLAGPTNSGKSTTIAGVVGEHFKMFAETKKRLSLENPVERVLDGITQISVDDNFAELVRALLRHDPDVVWVGEIRDAFSAAACVRAATSGHLVLSTVHANNSILAFRAISNYLRKDTGEATGGGASLFDLAESVTLLIGQRLVKKICPHCRAAHKVSAHELELVKSYLEAEGQSTLWDYASNVLRKGVYKASENGCKECAGTGYAGERPVNEVLPCVREVRDLFAKSDTRLDMTNLSKYRLNTLTQSALELLERGETELASIFV